MNEEQNEHKIPFSIDDFEDGLKQKEKYDLACDLLHLSTGLQAHDQSLLQLIGALNAIKKVLITSEIVTEDEYGKVVSEELEKIKNIFIENLKKEKGDA